MIFTFNGCYFTEIKVHPKNWKEAGASVRKPWYFYYRFYDPTVRDEKGKIKPLLVHGRGMNKFGTLTERRQITEALIRSEYQHLKEEGFNPITSAYMIEKEEEFVGEIAPDTPLIKALTKAKDLLNCGHRTRIGIKSVIRGVEKAATQLRFHEMPISKVGRKHIKKILSRCEEIFPRWSNNRYNLYRAYLQMLFKELVEQESIDANPINDISKKPTIKKMRTVLTPEERSRVDQHLRQVFYRFRMFVHLFFHSGGRKTELLQLKPPMVNLQTQKYRTVVKKGKRYVEVERTIKDVAVPFWEFFLDGCPDDHFIFGKLFKPGLEPMGQDMPSKYWKRYVKDPETGLGINVDFYPLKHLNTSEIVDLLDEEAAAELNAHTSTAMVVNVYDIRQRDRQHERLKRVNNRFA